MNIEVSKNNHLVWGYNGLPETKRNTPYDKFFIQFGKIEKEQTFRDSCIQSAIEISECASKNNKKPLVFFSGGIDSESIIYSFLLSSRDFSIAHIRYNPSLNDHEYEYVKKISKKYNLDIIFFDVDVEKFLLDPNTFDLAVRDNSIMIELHLLTCITNEIKDRYFPVLDHPGTYLYRENTNINEIGNWFYKDYEHLMFYYNHCVNEKMHGCPSFFHWSPEILFSFLNDSLVQRLVTGKILGKVTNRTSTLPLYQSTFPEYYFEPRLKFTGHEYISKDIINTLNFRLYSRLKYDRHSGQRYQIDELIKILKG